MKKRGKENEIPPKRRLALTIILGIFISIMIIILFNLIVSYIYPGPEYNTFCETSSETCYQLYQDALEVYNRVTFFIFAIIGFLLIVVGLFINILLIQLVTLPAGALLAIQAAIRNLDDKLSVIIIFSLLIAAAIFLAIKKLGRKL